MPRTMRVLSTEIKIFCNGEWLDGFDKYVSRAVEDKRNFYSWKNEKEGRILLLGSTKSVLSLENDEGKTRCMGSIVKCQ